ncbi:MAG: protein-export chaperone SecB [Chloroflexi bacterium]|nr:protein-export chaperone SecB [Chloroflexota bacterium]
MADKQEIKKTSEMIDVTPEATHYSVQCEDIRLISSTLQPIIKKGATDSASNFAFRIHAVVDGSQAYSYLEVQVDYIMSDEPDDVHGFALGYVLMGTFSADKDMSPEELGHFIKMYTLTILWPYAREYASDQLRRTGGDNIILPIINPQVVTEHIVENNLVEVEIIQAKSQK